MAFTGTAAVFSALSAGAAPALGATLLAVAEVGMVVGAVGAVTGNKDMVKVGGVMGLVGGVGFLAAGGAASLASAGASAVGQGAAATSTVAGEAGAALTSSGQWISGGSIAENALNAAAMEGIGTAAIGSEAAITQGIIEGAMPSAMNSMAGAADPSMFGTGSQVAPSQGGAITSAVPEPVTMAEMQGASAVAQPTSAVQAAPVSQSPSVAAQAASGKAPVDISQGVTTPASGGGSKGAFGTMSKGFENLGKWMKENKELSSFMVQVGGPALQGALGGDDSKMTEYQRRQIELEERRLKLAEKPSAGVPNRINRPVQASQPQGIIRPQLQTTPVKSEYSKA